ncbi:protoporphyrinogen oxidase [Chloropicon primus]|uniref:Protoporphyrinogen oxidase n=1 Tax=Chloropicon primus TaxID=1764295 RepID=A0A5B8MBW4_9CHLO|nr:protoporphyrinogen oxidase [Chloropicon primus]|eukprot:QDZ17897.1 protoporphyrinogen oxidase [Chloropicon primus]
MTGGGGRVLLGRGNAAVPRRAGNAVRRRAERGPGGRTGGRSINTVSLARQGPRVRSLAEERSEEPISGGDVSEFGEEQDVVLVGAGITGLCAALALRDVHGEDVKSFLVTETRDVVGGNVITKEKDGYIWEEGPNSFQPNDFVLKAALDAGCADELVFGDPTASRYVFWEGELRKVPSGPDAVTNNLLSLWGKIRAGLGAVGLLKEPAPDTEETVEQFIRRNLGDEVFYRLIEPFCSGVYAGDPTKLSMKAAFGKIWILEKNGGSLVGGALNLIKEKKDNPPPPRDPNLPTPPKGQTVGSFRKGLQTLPNAIGATLGKKVRLSWTLKDIDREGGKYKLTYTTPEGPVCVRAKSVVFTTPSYVAAQLLRREIPDAHSQLNSFFYPPVGSVVLSYPKTAIRDEMYGPDGRINAFGQLHPRTQGITTLGTIYSSSLFPGRCPDGEFLLSSYIGGTLNQGILDQTEEELAAQVDKDLRTMLLKPNAPKPKTVGVRVWQKAIPQFYLGHMEALDAANEAAVEAGYEGMFLSGNYNSGVALGKCVEGAYKVADDVAEYCRELASMSAPAAPASSEEESFFV